MGVTSPYVRDSSPFRPMTPHQKSPVHIKFSESTLITCDFATASMNETVFLYNTCNLNLVISVQNQMRDGLQIC